MSNNAFIALLLEGPMQSWGTSSRFTRRTTELFPTKSGVVGLLAAALGVDKYAPGEAQSLQKLASLNCTVIVLDKRRGDYRLPILRVEDYHTVGGGYEDRDKLHRLRSAKGKIKKDAALTKRHYLLDARFGVLLEGEVEQLSQIAKALQNPKWGLWLGRKCCIPASPLLVAGPAEKESVWKELLKRTGYPVETELDAFNFVKEVPAGRDEEDVEILNDTPIAFGAPIGNRHTLRYIRKHYRKASSEPNPVMPS